MSSDRLKNSLEKCRSIGQFENSQIPLFSLHTPATKDAFSGQWFLLERLTARERESGLAKNVLEGIDSQVNDMLVSPSSIL